MGVRQLVEDAVGAQQAKFAPDGSRTAPSLGFGRGWGSIQQALQIPIAQAVEGELAPVYRFQQSVIVRIKRMQRSQGSTVPADAAFDLSGQFRQRGAVVHPAQGRAVTVQGFLGDLSAAM